MSQINVRNLSNENDDGAPDIVGVSTFSATSYFVPPVGTTAERPENPEAGSIRFNTDFAGLEYFKGDTLNWEHIEMTSPDLNGGARGLFAGGQVAPSAGSYTNHIEYVTISTLGNGNTFGDLTATRSHCVGMASRSRSVFGSGYGPSNVIDYITIASTGNATDFGDLLYTATNIGGGANSTRMIVVGGTDTPGYSQVNTINYITIATLGNAVDFGDTSGPTHACAVMASPTRAVIKMGNINYPNTTNVIEYVEFATTGNTTDFGDSVLQTYGVGEGISNAHGGL